MSGPGGRQHPALRSYLAVFVALLGLTALTVWSAFQPLGALNTPVALTIASAKALLVCSTSCTCAVRRLTWVLASSGFLFLLVLLVFTLSDFWTRNWLPLYG